MVLAPVILASLDLCMSCAAHNHLVLSEASGFCFVVDGL